MQTDTIENIYIRERIIGKFWPIASLVLVVFILESFFVSKNYLTGWLHLINLLFLTAALFLCLRIKRVLLASNILAAIGM